MHFADNVIEHFWQVVAAPVTRKLSFFCHLKLPENNALKHISFSVSLVLKAKYVNLD